MDYIKYLCVHKIDNTILGIGESPEDAFEELLVMEQQTKVEDCCFYQLSSPKKFKLRLIEQIEID
jgi:hypothetical protein